MRIPESELEREHLRIMLQEASPREPSQDHTGGEQDKLEMKEAKKDSPIFGDAGGIICDVSNLTCRLCDEKFNCCTCKLARFRKRLGTLLDRRPMSRRYTTR